MDRRVTHIALVSMPFGPVALPGIGISLLAEALRRDGLICDIHYMNVQFAARIGPANYCALGDLSPPTALVGEWLFSTSLRKGSASESDSRYVENVLIDQYGAFFTPEVLLPLFDIRDNIESFLDECVAGTNWDTYDLVGFTTTFQQNMASLALAKRLKQLHPHIKVVFGGANCEAEMGAALHRNYDFIDYVCSGEGDRAFPALIQALNKGEMACDVAGIISRVGGQTVLPRKIVWPVENMDELPWPSYDDYMMTLRSSGLQIRPIIPFETSRGCWWGAKHHCTFCGLNGQTMSYRSKSQPRALEEVLYLAERYGDTFLCVDNIFDFHYFDWFLPKLGEMGRRISFHFETKVNLKKEQMRILRIAGVTHLQPGIESLSTPILRLMNKGCTLLQNVRCLKWARLYDITVAWNLLYGFPGESPSEYLGIAEAIPLLHHLDPPIFVSRIRMDRHSPYFTKPGKFGLSDVKPYPAYAHVYELPDRELFDIAYYFQFSYDSGQLVEEYVGDMVAQARKWQMRFADGVTLEAQPIDEGKGRIIDTREIAAERDYVLDSLAWSILCDCDVERRVDALRRKYLDNYPLERIDAAIEELNARQLILHEGGAVLALPVNRIDESVDTSLRDEFRLSTRMLMNLSEVWRPTSVG